MANWHDQESSYEDKNFTSESFFQRNVPANNSQDKPSFVGCSDKKYVDEDYIAPKPAISIRKWRVKVG